MGFRVGAIALSLVLAISSHANFQQELSARSSRYFLEHAHPLTGLVRDRARAFGATPITGSYRIASLASTGFGIATLAEAARLGKLDSKSTFAQIEKTLRFVHNSLENHHGWLYHFVDWETGKRAGRSEVSTIDTALFLAGALYAATVFPHSAISYYADKIYRRTDFPNMMTDGGTQPNRRTLSLGWTPESGYLPWQWDSYAEQSILVLLGLGHPEKPLPLEAWKAWKRTQGRDLPLFVHQYSHLFIPFEKIPELKKYFDNSVEATALNREVCQKAQDQSETYAAGFWGLSASGSAEGYRAYSPAEHDGTVCLGCAGASVMFDPSILKEMHAWAYGKWAGKIWGQYGFVDSLNLDVDWVDPDVIGITVGALYLALNPISEKFYSYPAIENALKKAALAENSLTSPSY